MKHFLPIVSVVLGLYGFFMEEAQAAEKREPLKVLYVGQSPSVPLKKYALVAAGAMAEERYAEDIRTRMPEFKNLLETFFEKVVCVDADAYTPELSVLYDVTIFDALPPSQLSSAKVKCYLPETYDCPIVFIGHTAPMMGESLGLKMDWYCMCLKEHALQIKRSHPVFKGPFVTDITLVERPTPTMVYNYANGNEIPLSLPMWAVQKEPVKGYRIGMVSHGDAFEDSPDAEVISGGECLKSIDAVAIARHGNFLMWGFAASPNYMTAEAQRVFANAICYINRFKGKRPIARKMEKGVTVRERIQDNLDILEKGAYEAYCKRMRMNGREPLMREGFIKQFLHKDLYTRFGNDGTACKEFLKENMNYFYGNNYSFVVDKEVKSLGIANNDKRLLDKCIRMLETGRDTAKARSILARYTVCNFATPEAWREWFGRYRSKLFFTESGGYKFMVNDEMLEQPVLPREFSKPKTTMEPTRDNPVLFSATLQNQLSGKGELVLNGCILDGFHIYASTNGNCPFYITKVEIDLPEGYKKVGTLAASPSRPMEGEETIQVYEQKVVFKQKYEGHSFQMNPVAHCKVTYQCCDNQICMPPVTDEFEIPLQ